MGQDLEGWHLLEELGVDRQDHAPERKGAERKPEPASKLAPVRIVQILAPPAALAARLAARGREGSDDIDRRLERAAAGLEPAADMTTITNDRTLDLAVAQFVAVLRAVASQPARR